MVSSRPKVMATCGYICPVCEGKGYTGEGMECSYCQPGNSGGNGKKEAEVNKDSDKEWMDKVHGSCCCSDIGDDSHEQK